MMAKNETTISMESSSERRKLCAKPQERGYGATNITHSSAPTLQALKSGLSAEKLSYRCAGHADDTSGYDTAATADRDDFRPVRKKSSEGAASRDYVHESSGDGLIEGDATGQESLLERLAGRIPCLGIMFALCASVFLGSAGMLVKLTSSVHGVQVAVFRAMIQSLLYGSVVAWRGLNWVPCRSEFRPVLGRALFGGVSITFSYSALKLIPLADATTIRFSMPIWTIIIGYLVLKERFGCVHVFAVITCIMGVVLIAKPDTCIHLLGLLGRQLALFKDSQEPLVECAGDQLSINNKSFQVTETTLTPLANTSQTTQTSNSGHSLGGASLLLLPVDEQLGLLEGAAGETMAHVQALPAQDGFRQFEGTLFALSSSICLAVSLVCLRLCKRTPVEITIFWLSLLSVLIGSGLLLFLNEWRLPNNWLDVLFILLNGLCGSVGQWFITNALKIEQSGVISLVRTADIQVAFLYGALVLDEPIKRTSLLGSLLVTSGVVALAIPKLVAEKGCGCWRRSSGAASSGRDSNWSVQSQPPPGEPNRRTADIEVAAPNHLGEIPSIEARKLSLSIPPEVCRECQQAEKPLGEELAKFAA